MMPVDAIDRAAGLWSACLCSQDASRSLVVGGHGMPFCARCSGIWFGVALALATSFVRARPLRTLSRPATRFMLGLIGLGVGSVLLGGSSPGFDAPDIRFVSGAGAGLATGLFVSSLFARRLLGRGTPWCRRDAIVTGVSGVVILVALPIARAIEFDFITMVLALAVPACGVMAAASVLDVAGCGRQRRDWIIASSVVLTALLLVFGAGIRR